MKVSTWLARFDGKAATVQAGDSIDEVIERLLLAGECQRDVYVLDESGSAIGHLSHRRLAMHLLAEHNPEHTRRQLMERVAGGTAADFMDADFTSCTPDERLDDVLHRQLEREIEDMPVLDAKGRLVGAVNLTQVLRHFLRAKRRNAAG